MSTKQRDIQSLTFAFGDAASHGDLGLIAFITGEGYNTWYRYVYDNTIDIDAPAVIGGRFSASGGRWVAAVQPDQAIEEWAATTAYVTGDVVSINGFNVIRLTDGNSGATYDAAEASSWSLVNRMPDFYTIAFTTMLPAGTRIKLDGTGTGGVAIPGVTVSNETLITVADWTAVLSQGFLVYLNDSNVTPLVTVTGDEAEFSFNVDDGDVLTIREASSEGNGGDVTVNQIQEPTAARVSRVSTNEILSDSDIGKICVVETGGSVTIQSTGTIGTGYTIVNISGAQITLGLGGSLTAIGDLNIADQSAVSVVRLGSDQVLVSGGVA